MDQAEEVWLEYEVFEKANGDQNDVLPDFSRYAYNYLLNPQFLCYNYVLNPYPYNVLNPYDVLPDFSR
jgi:hypothetical protein